MGIVLRSTALKLAISQAAMLYVPLARARPLQARLVRYASAWDGGTELYGGRGLSTAIRSANFIIVAVHLDLI